MSSWGASVECKEDSSRCGEESAVEADEQTALEIGTRAEWERHRPGYNAWAAQSGEPPSEFDHIVNSQVESTRVGYQKSRAWSELEQYSVLWDLMSAEDAASLQELLDSNPDEPGVHRFLENNPKFLVQTLSGGHDRFQISKQRLGSEFVPDLLIAEMSSIGIEWHAVELETPKARVQRKDGLPAHALNHAIGQIRDWRSWLTNNSGYARRSKVQHGLGLVGIDSRVPGLILIGRREEYSERFNEFRRQMIDRERILIHSYDWLVDVARSNHSGWMSRDLPRQRMNR